MSPVNKYTPSDPRQQKLTPLYHLLLETSSHSVESNYFREVRSQADQQFLMPSRKHLSYNYFLRGHASILAKGISCLESASILSNLQAS